MRTQDSLKVSVVIATLNRCRLLRRALESLTKQSRPPDEVIVVDNGSTDDTRAVCQEFSNVLPLVYVYEPNRGISRARNAGIRRATGDIFCFLDDDCVADGRWLEYMEDPFLRDPEIACVGGNIIHADTDRSVIAKLYALKTWKAKEEET